MRAFCAPGGGGYLEALLLSSVSEYHGGMSDNDRMISDEAVEAAFRSMWGPNPSNPSDSGDAHLLKELRKALEAAAPYIRADLAKKADECAAEDMDNYFIDQADVGGWIRSLTNPYRSPSVSERFAIKREVEHEAGREHVWWTVIDCESGYNKTFRTEAEAKAHAAHLTKPSRSQA